MGILTMSKISNSQTTQLTKVMRTMGAYSGAVVILGRARCGFYHHEPSLNFIEGYISYLMLGKQC